MKNEGKAESIIRQGQGKPTPSQYSKLRQLI